MRIAITGRPNVGKSTLFNRLTGRKQALVDPLPGLTRDCREVQCVLAGHKVWLVDMPGYEGEGRVEASAKTAHKAHHEGHDEVLAARMNDRAREAAAEADLCLFMVDARAGLLPADREWALFLRRQHKPVIVMANKCEGEKARAGLWEAYGLGFGEVIELSAEHGLGFSELETALEEKLAETPSEEAEAEEAPVLTLAILGRPNSGKSTLTNRLLGEDRMMTGPEQGITRDSLFFPLEWKGQQLRIADTGGMRRKAKITARAEYLTVASSISAMRNSQVIVLLMDITTPYEKQDMHLADLIAREGKAALIVLNKSDLLSRMEMKEKRIEGRYEAALLPGTPVLAISAETGAGVNKILPAAFELYAGMNKEITTGQLNRWLTRAVERHPPTDGRRFKYIVQTGTAPPHFTIFANREGVLPAPYRRYLASGIRNEFGYAGLPLRFTVRGGKNPYAGD